MSGTPSAHHVVHVGPMDATSSHNWYTILSSKDKRELIHLMEHATSMFGKDDLPAAGINGFRIEKFGYELIIRYRPGEEIAGRKGYFALVIYQVVANVLP